MNTKFDIGSFIVYKIIDRFSLKEIFSFGTVKTITINSKGIYYDLGLGEIVNEEDTVFDERKYLEYIRNFTNERIKEIKNSQNEAIKRFYEERNKGK